MTRQALGSADPQDVESLRWSLFARALAPEVTFDFAAAIRRVEIAGMSGKAHDAAAARERKKTIEELRGGQRQQSALRSVLHLDDPDDEDDEEPDEGVEVFD